MVLAILATTLAPDEARAEGELAIVAHADWPGLDEVSLAFLRQLYLGRRTRTAGRRVHCLDLPAGSPPRAAFTRRVLGWSERALERYWLRQALSGGPPPPRELSTAAEILAIVAIVPGAIGYVPWSEIAAGVPQGVRVVPVEVDGRGVRPGEPGYPLVVPLPPR